MWSNTQFPADLVIFTEETLNGKLHFLCSAFHEGIVITGEESYTQWKKGWKKLKKILTEGQKKNKQQSLAEKNLQGEIPQPEKTLAGRNVTLTPGKHHQYLRYRSKL